MNCAHIYQAYPSFRFSTRINKEYPLHPLLGKCLTWEASLDRVYVYTHPSYGFIRTRKNPVIGAWQLQIVWVANPVLPRSHFVQEAFATIIGVGKLSLVLCCYVVSLEGLTLGTARFRPQWVYSKLVYPMSFDYVSGEEWLVDLSHDHDTIYSQTIWPSGPAWETALPSYHFQSTK